MPPIGRRCLARIGDEGEQQPADGGQQARQRVGDELGAPDRHARHVGRRLGRADRRAPRARAPSGGTAPRPAARPPAARTSIAGTPPGSAPVSASARPRVHVAARHRPQPQRDAVVDRAGRQRGDDRLQPAVDDDHAVDERRTARRPPAPRPRRAPPAAACPTTRCEARQLASTNTMPTDRSMPAGQHRQRLRHGDDGQQHALVGGGGRAPARSSPTECLVM